MQSSDAIKSLKLSGGRGGETAVSSKVSPSNTYITYPNDVSLLFIYFFPIYSVRNIIYEFICD